MGTHPLTPWAPPPCWPYETPLPSLLQVPSWPLFPTLGVQLAGPSSPSQASQVTRDLFCFLLDLLGSREAAPVVSSWSLEHSLHQVTEETFPVCARELPKTPHPKDFVDA